MVLKLPYGFSPLVATHKFVDYEQIPQDFSNFSFGKFLVKSK
jgi:hypothetical protein